jgi:2-phosphosulfolactate phosphatase
VADLFGQGEYAVRLDWGPAGARATRADVSVVVDVLSFSTSVTVAVQRGMQVFPYRWNDASAGEFAARHDAVLAVGRLGATRQGAVGGPSLSPAELLDCPVVPRLVLPSPNGSTIAAELQAVGGTVAIGCLRNPGAVAAWLVQALEAGRSVAVVAAGEHWSHDRSLRPALEDHLGAGAILSALSGLGWGDALSPEALSAVDVFVAGRDHLAERLHGCVGGRELAAKGFPGRPGGPAHHPEYNADNRHYVILRFSRVCHAPARRLPRDPGRPRPGVAATDGCTGPGRDETPSTRTGSGHDTNRRCTPRAGAYAIIDACTDTDNAQTATPRCMARRSSGVVPPHTPYGSRTDIACSKHCWITGQVAHSAFARCSRLSRRLPRSASCGKNSSGSVVRHAPSVCHS